MGKGAGNHEFCASSTVPHLSIETIDPTFPRAKLAFLEEFLQEPNPLAEISFFKEMDIGRDKRHLSITPGKYPYFLIINYHKILRNSI